VLLFVLIGAFDILALPTEEKLRAAPKGSAAKRPSLTLKKKDS